MQFVQATFLAAAAAVAIPVIVHLLFRSQARRVNLGTLRFLKQVLERNAQRQRIMRWLLLALRMAAVAVLALLFARPYFLEASLAKERKLLLILIDSSASMDLRNEHGRLIEQALAEAREIVNEQGTQTQVEIAFFDHAVRPLNPTSDSATANAGGYNLESALVLLRDWPLPVSSHRSTNYGAAINWARDLAIRVPATQQELHIFTDLQQSGLDWTEVEPLPQQVEVQLHDLGRVAVNNLAVTEARPLPSNLHPGEGTAVQATLLNSSPFPVAAQTVALKLESGQKKLSFKERVKLEAGSTGAVTFDVPALEAGLWAGTVSIEADDDLAFDNARHVAIRCAAPYRILIADGQPHPLSLLSESYFLSAALRLAAPDETYSKATFDVSVAPLELEARLPALDPFAVVVLANPGAVSEAEARRLQDFVSAGGGLVVFGGDQVTAKGCESLRKSGLTPGKVIGPMLTNDLPFRIDAWDEGHTLLLPFQDPQHGDIRRLSFRGYTRVLVTEAPTQESERKSKTKADSARPHVLARFRNGDPVLIEQRVGAGSVLWCAIACDRAWSEWTNSRLYVPLVHQLIGQSLGLNDGGPIRPMLIDAEHDAAGALQPGLSPQIGYWDVVNASPRESETDRCTLEEFADRFQMTLQTEESIPIAPVTQVSRSDLRPNEQWHWAALAVFALLLTESFVANRTVS